MAVKCELLLVRRDAETLEASRNPKSGDVSLSPVKCKVPDCPATVSAVIGPGGVNFVVTGGVCFEGNH